MPTWARLPLTVTRPSPIRLSASRREQAPLSLRYLLSRTFLRSTLLQAGPPCRGAPAVDHTADDAARYAVSRDGVLDGLPAPARRCARPRARAGPTSIERFLRVLSGRGLRRSRDLFSRQVVDYSCKPDIGSAGCPHDHANQDRLLDARRRTYRHHDGYQDRKPSPTTPRRPAASSYAR